ncbi:MAG: nadB [Actinomycetia bacterium]|nr:nadB [Actinomycetes bacterium]
MTDVLVLGSGVAGLSAAVHAAGAGLSAVVMTKGELPDSATWYAQGGVAAALEAPDSPTLHLADTLTAGAGLCDVDAVRILVTEGPERVRNLIALGAVFDVTGDGEAAVLALAREGGHSLARVVHAGGDATGAEIERALVAAVRATAAEIWEGWFSTELIVEGGRCAGVRAVGPAGEVREVRARHTVLATGGVGQIFEVTTNPALSTGDGIAMAWRAGAAVADIEFMQFHPTALHHPSMPRPLLSEALRGEGAILRDEHGVAFMVGEHPLGDLAPRDVVARAITRRLRERGVDHLWLDATAISGFAARFPTIWRASQAVGLDPETDWLPVAPAAHYLSGGVCADLHGATTLPGLWACGEAACSGVHGANRLASNSLLDGMVFGPRAIEAIVDGRDGPGESGVLRGVDLTIRPPAPPVSVVPDPAAAAADASPAELRAELQHEMTLRAGVLREASSLAAASAELVGLRDRSAALASSAPDAMELRNLVAVASILVDAATRREESRGTHTRLDFPERSDRFLGRFVRSGAGAPELVPLPSIEELPSTAGASA